MTITYHRDLIQGSEEWHAARCGLLTASEINLILTPTLKIAANEKTRAHVWELLAQRISRYVEPSYIGDDMLRGYEDEILARKLYAETCAPVEEVGFVTNDKWGLTLGCSPDGMVGDDGVIECKSRRQKYQVETIANLAVPDDHLLQVQALLLITERQWLDYISYSGGLPMMVLRVYPDAKVHDAIVEAAAAFEATVAEKLADYRASMETHGRLFETERRVEQEMYV